MIEYVYYMLSHRNVDIKRLLRIDFVRFCIVGGTGFCINLVLLLTLNNLLGIVIFLAQLISAEIALFSNFMLHHHWTYGHKKVEKSISKLIIQFHATTWPAIIGSTIMVTFAHKTLHFNNFLALVVSSATALMWNYLWSKYVVWKGVTKQEIDRITE